MSDSVRPQRQQPTRLPRPRDSPGKNTEVGCHFLLQCMKVKSESEITQSCLTLRDLIDGSLPGCHPWDFPGKSTRVGCHLYTYPQTHQVAHFKYIPSFLCVSHTLIKCFKKMTTSSGRALQGRLCCFFCYDLIAFLTV